MKTKIQLNSSIQVCSVMLEKWGTFLLCVCMYMIVCS